MLRITDVRNVTTRLVNQIAVVIDFVANCIVPTLQIERTMVMPFDHNNSLLTGPSLHRIICEPQFFAPNYWSRHRHTRQTHAPIGRGHVHPLLYTSTMDKADHLTTASPIIIYSHGFGVAKDDRGLFPNLAQFFPEYRHVMFDYNDVAPDGRTMTDAPFDRQVAKFTAAVQLTHQEFPDALLYVIAHSQGCITAALAEPPVTLTAVALLAPPDSLTVERMRQVFGSRGDSVINLEGESQLHRTDGSVTLVQPAYWQSIANLAPTALYNALAKRAPISVITASHDEVLGLSDFSRLNNHIPRQTLNVGHNFAGDGRRQAAALIRSIWEHQPLPANATDPHQEFAGTKGLIFIGHQVVIYRRSADAPKYPLKLDVPGGGRENHEPPTTTFIREAQEEFNLTLVQSDIIYSRSYAASNGSGELGYYMVAKLPSTAVHSIQAGQQAIHDLNPGQESRTYELMDLPAFLCRTDAWPAWQRRAQDYLDYQN